MLFDHEKLDVYQVSIKMATEVFKICKSLGGVNRFARDQLLRASQSVPLNIAEGNGKSSGPDRRRFVEIARGSALESAAIFDILLACDTVTPEQATQIKKLLLRIVSMLTKMMQAQNSVREEICGYDCCGENDEHDAGHGWPSVEAPPDGKRIDSRLRARARARRR